MPCTNSLPIMLALCSMLLPSYYAPNYAGIIGLGLFYITKPSQICHDRVLPRDLNTTQKSAAPAEYGMLRASGKRRKLWPKKTLNVCFVEKNHQEDEIFEIAHVQTVYVTSV